MTEPRVIAVVREYQDLIAACRVRMTELGITFATLDEVSGVQVGYSAKLIGPTPCKNIGPMSFGSLVGALRMKLVAVEDEDALATLNRRLEKRLRPARILRIGSIPWLITPLRAQELNKTRTNKLSAKRRKEIGRKAIKSRWRATRRLVKQTKPDITRVRVP